MLRIETGRHQRPKIDIQERTCLFCDTHEIDDEEHLVSTCSYHTKERELLLLKLNLDREGCSSKEQLQSIMSDRTPEHLAAIGQFLFDCFAKRSATIQL